MRVCIDGSPLLLQSAGVKTYLYHWTRQLRELAGDDVRIFPYLNSWTGLDHQSDTRTGVSNLARILLLHFVNIPWNPALEWLTSEVQLFHATNQVHNPPRNKKLSATIHDLTCWLMPELHRPQNVTADKTFAERVVQRADGLIAVSESSRDDAVRLLGIPREKIEVIYPGVSPAYFEASSHDVALVKTKYHLSQHYVLFVGTIEPRKNLDLLLDAYQGLEPSLREQFPLFVAGPIGWASDAVAARLRSPDSPARYLGYVSESDLPGLTAGASLCVYPSLYEGFGFPVVQAMAAGVPVLTSNVSSLPEVAGDAAFLVDPRSINEVQSGLQRLLSSSSLRRKLAHAGRQRVQSFRWEDSARKSWEFFEKICGR